jgi:hypothetical protein
LICGAVAVHSLACTKATCGSGGRSEQRALTGSC